MVCSPSQNTINLPPPGPGPSLPGLGVPFDIPGIPLDDLFIPDGVPESLIDLVEQIFALFPSGIKFFTNVDNFTKDVLDAVANLFNQLAPFLGFYKFFQALLNIILCIIDVLCALLNPWALASAINKLFKQCLPEFLSLFPWIALLVMILALLLLLAALIQYIIDVIIAYIEQIIENLRVLKEAIDVGAEETIIAITNKLSYLLCSIENLFAILMALGALFQIIRPLMDIGGRGACFKGSGCCTEDFCPSFISNAGNSGQFSSSGTLIYYSEIGIPDLGDDFKFFKNMSGFVQRPESWQMTDSENENFKFIDIITPSPEFGFIYWPEGESYDKDANLNKVPYTMNFNITVDPAEWGNPEDVNGERKFNIRNVIVNKKPTVKPTDKSGNVNVTSEEQYDGSLVGAISFVGGKVYEYNENEDGYINAGGPDGEYVISDIPATIETFLTRNKGNSIFPVTDDGYYFLDVEYNFKPNNPCLVDKKLITLMCVPDSAAEAATLNAEFSDLRSVFDKTGELPDVNGAVECLNKALLKLRNDLTPESAQNFVTESSLCLNNLLGDVNEFYCRAALAAADRYKSEFSIKPEIQFIKKPIKVTVQLKDKTGTQLAVNVNDKIGECIASGIDGVVTLGEISKFSYDGYGEFTADISSIKEGTGELKVYINGESLASILNRDNLDVRTEIVERSIPYEFIGYASVVYRTSDADTSKTRFDDSDIAEDGV